VYGFKTERDIARYTDHMIGLSQKLPVWPPVEEILAATKWNLIQTLDTIAANVTHTIRPRTTILETPVTSLESLEGFIVKRERSDCSRHFVSPQGIQKMGLTGLNKWLRRYWVDGASWLKQEYVPQLATLGEWRVYIIDRKISFTLLTEWIRGKVVCTPQTDIWTLQELR
jgi:hypothetical protein